MAQFEAGCKMLKYSQSEPPKERKLTKAMRGVSVIIVALLVIGAYSKSFKEDVCGKIFGDIFS